MNFVFFSNKIFGVKRSHQIMYNFPKQNIENWKTKKSVFKKLITVIYFIK